MKNICSRLDESYTTEQAGQCEENIMSDHQPPNSQSHESDRIGEVISLLCEAIVGSRMQNCLIAHAVLVSNLLDQHPKGRAAGFREFKQLLHDCSVGELVIERRTLTQSSNK